LRPYLRAVGAAKEEGIALSAVAQDNAGDESSFDDEIETCSLKLFLEAEDLVEDTGLVWISLLKAKGEDLHPGFRDVGGESVRRAVNFDPDLLAEDDPGRICKTVKDPLPDVSDNALELNHLTVFTEVGAAPVSGIGWEERAVGSQDFEGEESQKVGYLYEGMENAVVQGLTQAIFEIGEGGLTGDKAIANACIDPVVLPLDGVAQHLNECFHIGILFEVAEQFDQEQTHRVIGEANEAVSVGNDGADKGEIYQGRDESGKTANDAAVGVEFYIPALIGVLR
jgi:hypothetical protein